MDTKPELTFANLWGADAGTLVEVGLGFNRIYRFEIKGVGHYLRIANPHFRALSDVVRATDFLLCLAESGAPVCEPIASRTGNWIEQHTHESVTYVATVVREVTGPKLSQIKLATPVCQAWGTSLAQMHQAGANYYEPAPGISFLSWQDLWNEVATNFGSGDDELKSIFADIDRWIKSHPVTRLNFGLTHGDYRLDNVIASDKGPVTIDFDEPVFHWFMADIARAMIDVAGLPDGKRTEILNAFVEGYREFMPLSDADLDAMPRFMIMKELDRYTWSRSTKTASDDDLDKMKTLIITLASQF